MDAIERGDRQVLDESPFVGEAADFVIIGIPDAVVFADRKPQLILDRKTTSILDCLFKNQRLQVWLYGYMLDSLGFETNELRLAILTHEQRLGPEESKRLQQLVLHGGRHLDDGMIGLMSDPDAYLYQFPYGVTDYLEDLRWAMEY